MGAALQADGENEVRVNGLKHQKEKRSMDHFAGLDVSVRETSICIVDDAGKIVRACTGKSAGFSPNEMSQTPPYPPANNVFDNKPVEFERLVATIRRILA